MTNLASFPQDTPAAVIPDDAAPAPTTVAVTQDQLTQWHADLMEQQQQVAQLRQAWQAAVAAWEQCLPGSQRVSLHREANLAETAYRQEEDRLAVFERFLALIEQGQTKEQALALLDGPAPGEGEHKEDAAASATEPPVRPDASPDEVPAPPLEGDALRKALFSALVELFLGSTPDPALIKLERGRYNKAIKTFAELGIQPSDVQVLKAAYHHCFPHATCTALAIANRLGQLIPLVRERGYVIGRPGTPETTEGDEQ